MRDAASRPLDQADGLRRLFRPARRHVIAVAANAHVAFSSVLLERLTAACAALGGRTLVVDAGDSAPRAHELALLDLAACIEPLSDRIAYLAARGLPLRHVDTRGSCAGLLEAIGEAAPDRDVIIVHAGASELGRMFLRQAVRPLLLAADHPESVTQAYAAMKLLALRNGLMAFDLLLAASAQSLRRQRITEQLASCADTFLGAVLRDAVCIDPACDVAEAPPAELLALVRAQLAFDTGAPLPAPPTRAADTRAAAFE